MASPTSEDLHKYRILKDHRKATHSVCRAIGKQKTRFQKFCAASKSSPTSSEQPDAGEDSSTTKEKAATI